MHTPIHSRINIKNIEIYKIKKGLVAYASIVALTLWGFHCISAMYLYVA